MNSFDNLSELYEITKTLHFELKPSLYTKERINFQNIKFDALKDHKSFFSQAEKIAIQQQDLFTMLRNGDLKRIQIHKALIKMIDADIYYKLKKDKLSTVISVSEIIKKQPGFVGLRQDYLTKYGKYLSQTKHRYNSYVYQNTSKEFTHQKNRATDITFAQKKLCLTLVKCNQIIECIIYKTGKVDQDLKISLINYQNIKGKDDFLTLAEQSYKSYSPRSGYEQHRFGLNAKAIKKKVDVERMEQKVQELRRQVDKLEEKKILQTNMFDAYTKHFNEYVIHGKDRDTKTRGVVSSSLVKGDSQLQALRMNATSSPDQIKQAKLHLKTIRDGNYDYWKLQKAIREGKQIEDISQVTNKKKNNGDKTYADLKTKKTDASMQYGRKRGELLAYEQELFNQQQLTHYARLVRQGESFFVVMIDRDRIAELEHIQNISSSDTHILEYHSLTAKAVGKLLFDNNALQDFTPKYKTIKKIRESRSYKAKGSTDTHATTDQEKQNLKELITRMNGAIKKLNTKLEGGVFGRKPFTQTCNNINDFLNYITKTCYSIKRYPVDWNLLKQRDQQGKIDLYQLYNKDFAVHPYCATTERDEASFTTEKKVGKPNLYTIYRHNLITDIHGESIRLNPESKLYLRPAKGIKDIDDYVENKKLSKQRFRENKVIANFQLVFYPTVSKPFDQLQKTMTEAVKGSHAIGIDLGENSLAMICVVDETGKVVVESNKSLIADLTMINNKGDFVEEKDCIVDGVIYKRKDKLLMENKDKKYYYLTDWYFSKNIANTPIKDFSQEQLKQALEEIEKLDPDHLDICDIKGNKVFDYAYAFEFLKTKNKILYHLQSFDKSEDEKELIENELLDSTRIRNGYTSKVVSYITRLAKQYNAMIVFENLDQGSNANGITLFAEKEFGSVSPKECRHLKGLSPYQLIQNTIIKKCNYLLTKENDGSLQTTPKLHTLQDIKDLTQIKGQKDCGWGTVVFVNEENTSQECPACGFIGGDENTKRYDQNNDTFEYKKGGQAITIPGIDEKIKERIDIVKSIIQKNKKYKPGDIAKTRVKYIDLVKSGHWSIEGDPMICIHCGYDTRKQERVDTYNLTSCDEIAAYIIAKRGQKHIQKSILSLPIITEKQKNTNNDINNIDYQNKNGISGKINFIVAKKQNTQNPQ